MHILLLRLIEYIAFKGMVVLGENNYCSYQVEGSQDKSHELSVDFGLRKNNPELITVNAPFEKEIRRAYALADDLVLSVDELYAQLRIGKQVDLESTRALLASCALSIETNMYAWMFLCQVKNPASYLVEHAFRTAALSMCLGLNQGLKRAELVELGLAALLSDVGKIMIPSAILEKEGALSSAEYAVIRVHPLEGRKILLSQTNASRELIEVVVSHHEQIDGEGYPAKLKGNEIPFFARLVSIADAFDAMTSERSYAPARSIRDAKSILWECKDKQFDAEFVDRFILMLGAFPPGTEVMLADAGAAVVLEPFENSATDFKVLCYKQIANLDIDVATKDADAGDKRYISSLEPHVVCNFRQSELRKQLSWQSSAHKAKSKINN
ncbi:hypothetical protein A3742_02520 [Oleiphilus sp. HI0071]|uniref:HD-GYP domain-containing protein n=2 Tax=Oleiphilus TaxID=141450 RepID=UPI0007C37D37|nr:MULTISPECIES: HD domain-containing phosphohydrolase [unclassified Oleiphilus]KZY78963.1 hypothetical protein A3742_02520 [Oleiphilus sp. HI0071]KZY91906.1 hypothetical protein A3744_03440 [Oleiphilus sp. HI0073]KZZ57907.1 hypothetical protein A3760_07275 [Oleiphilus sp. HI0122]KZZ78387.1 hypothetical protein A3765_01155 [Oleiphilus sp. HI0130]KZZ81801.1 hypothetical protein A3767_06795 [Oleiphilus sp. HI0133]